MQSFINIKFNAKGGNPVIGKSDCEDLLCYTLYMYDILTNFLLLQNVQLALTGIHTCFY